MKKLFFISLAFFIGFDCFGQITFQKTFSGGGGSAAITTSDGGYIAVGETSLGAGNSDIHVIKTDMFGDFQWSKTYGGSDRERVSNIEQTSDGGYLIAGHTESFGLSNGYAYLIKINSTGILQWSHAYGNGITTDCSEAHQTADGGYVLVGTNAIVPWTEHDVLLIKTDSNGNISWSRSFNHDTINGGVSVIQTNDEGFAIIGYTGNFNTGYDVSLIKTNINGNLVWAKTYDAINFNYPTSGIETTDGGFAITEFNGQLFKTDSSGNLQWAKRYSYSDCKDVKQTTDGGYILSGATMTYSYNVYDAFLIKTDAVGDTIWTRTYSPTFGENRGYSASQTPDGGYFLTGSLTDSLNFYMVKTDSNGNSGCFEYNIGTVVSTLNPVVGAAAFSVGTGFIVYSTPTITTTPSTTFQTFCETVGLNEEPLQPVKTIIYPNPTSGKFTVQGASGEIQIFDLFGRLVIRSNEKEIDMSNYPAGLYIWRVGEARGKVVIE